MLRKEFENEMTKVANSLFEKDTVEYEPGYIPSASCQRRRMLRANFNKNNSFIFYDYESDKNIKRIPFYCKFGPYEIKILNKIISCNEGYIFYQGGSRSGKSSVFKFLQKKIDENNSLYFNELRCGQIIKREQVDIIKIININMDAYDSNLSEDQEYTNEELINAVILFFRSLQSLLFTGCQESFANKSLYFDSFIELYEKFSDLKISPDMFSDVLRSVKSKSKFPDIKTWSKLNDGNKENLIRNIIDTYTKPLDIFLILIAPLWYMVNSHFATSNDFDKLILVIDNIDPQPTFFQQKIASIIRAACKTTTWKNLNSNNRINIVIPVRLSTFKRRINQLGDYENIEHESFYPSDIVFYRLQNFIFTNGEKSYFSQIENVEIKKAIFLRIYSLWSHISDRNSYFRTSLDAISGTNINHGNILAQNWCVSDKFSLGYITDDFKLDDNFKKIELEASDALVNEIWISFVRIFKFIFSETDLSEIDDTNINTIVYDIFENTVKSLFYIYRDHRLIFSEKYHDPNNIRHSIYSGLSHSFKNRIIDFTKSKELREKIFTKFSDELIYVTHSIVENNILNNKLINLFCELFISDSVTNIQNRISKVFLDYTEIVHVITIFFIEIIKDFQKKYNMPYYVLNPVNFIEDLENSYSNNFKPYAPKISRFEAAEAFLEFSTEHKSTNISVENIFTKNKLIIKPVGLHILYILYTSNDYISSSGYITDMLEIYGYNYDKDIIPVLQNMVRIDRRLIFCEVNDYEYGINKIIKERNTPIYLSNAGKGYVENLIMTPPYLQWALLEKKNKNDNMVDKISIIFQKFQEIISSEILSIQNYVNSPNPMLKPFENFPSYYCATYDLLLKSLDYDIYSLISHYNKPDLSKSKKTQSKNLVNEMYTYTKNTLDSIIKLLFFGHAHSSDDETIKNWHNIIGNIEKIKNSII